jgi:hypothetical protein
MVITPGKSYTTAAENCISEPTMTHNHTRQQAPNKGTDDNMVKLTITVQQIMI